jgi:hypothetical protein
MLGPGSTSTGVTKRSGVTRPCNCWSIIIEGPKAQLPKRYTGSNVMSSIAGRAVMSTPKLDFACASSATLPSA